MAEVLPSLSFFFEIPGEAWQDGLTVYHFVALGLCQEGRGIVRLEKEIKNIEVSPF
jgi:hypothetical protein